MINNSLSGDVISDFVYTKTVKDVDDGTGNVYWLFLLRMYWFDVFLKGLDNLKNDWLALTDWFINVDLN